MQTYIAISKSALDENLSLAMLYCPKCKVMHIDVSNSVAKLKIKCNELTILENIHFNTQTHKQPAHQFLCYTQNYKALK